MAAEFREQVQQHLKNLRDRIVARFEELEPSGAKFQRTAWERPGGGGGEMSEIRGELFEKGGCNFSAVHGEKYPGVPEGNRDDPECLPPSSEEVAGKPFFACGVSLVMHPRNPNVPVVHMNVRYISVGDLEWFGGGMDLTPWRPVEEDTRHFHRVLEQVCGPKRYPRFSAWARDYFFIKHRGSERGVGGVFFDYLRGRENWDFQRSIGEAFLHAYVPIVEKRRHDSYSDEDRASQLKWRGRYVEFNLIYDRGTLFGLRSGGNIDAIFMSLPPLVSW